MLSIQTPDFFNKDKFPMVKEDQHKVKGVVGMRIKSFNNHTFGVVREAYVAKITKTHVTLNFGPDLNETFPKNKEEWFILPQGHPNSGEFFIFE